MTEDQDRKITETHEGMKRITGHYYGNGKMGDRTRILLMWRGVGGLLFFAGYGAHSLFDVLIRGLVAK